jgi:amidophosphoribosyltransferase
MCGIVGLFLKDQSLQPRLGSLVESMLSEMGDRGPDSAGFAIYRDPVDEGEVKITLSNPDDDYAWDDLAASMESDLAVSVRLETYWNHAVLAVRGDERAVLAWLRSQRPEVRVTSAGTDIEIFKEQGTPEEVSDRFGLAEFEGSHALGHTRMATESAVTTEHSHPFSTGRDLCLVHNGSLSNHNRLRRELERRGVTFETDNDSEVAAGFFTMKLSQGLSLEEALEEGLSELDGFYTFAIGTKDGFAVLRDSFACKPAVLAETDRWVAMASEYRALDHLPGASQARIWEPEPAVVYTWSRN